MRSCLRPLSWLIGATLVLAPVGAGAGAPASERARVDGELMGRTVIRWNGVKGMVLDNTRENVWLPLSRMKLKVEGDYAYVAISPVRQPRARSCPAGLPHCEKFELTYIRDIYERAGAAKVTMSHLTEPPFLWAQRGPIELYLIADGDATLVLEPKAIPGRSSYVAGGRVVGGMERLPVSCPTPGCDPATGYGDRYRVGGKTVDLGRLGYSAVWVYAGTRDDDAHNQSHPVRACQYPWPGNPNASPEASDHPWGCDPVGDPTDPASVMDAAHQTSLQVGNAAGPGTLQVINQALHGVSGRSYIGYHAGAAGPWDGVMGGYGIWFRYGIRSPG